MAVPVLTYHANNVSDNTYAGNDHVALAADLVALSDAGWQFIGLDELLGIFSGHQPGGQKRVAITFDDGSDFDFHDIEHPTCGRQRSLFNIVQDFRSATGTSVKASSFVVASPEARVQLDQHCLIGKDWWNDDWWREANASNVLSIESHGWDHLHPVLEKPAQREGLAGDFRHIKDYEDCKKQLEGSAELIECLAGRRPRYFAYPWGQFSHYLAGEYLPNHQAAHGYQAAFTTVPEPVTRSHDRWRLPRYVCGEHWRSPGALLTLLEEAC